jgi:anti-sigma B factor antagonist
MADPSYPIVMIGGVPVVDAPQEIDAVNAEWFRTVLLHAASCGPATVVVNMAGTRFCNSSGVGVLAWAHGLAAAEGGQLLLVIPADATVLRVLAFAGIDRLIPHFAELPEAIQQAHAVVPRPLHRRAVPSAGAGLPDV